MKRRMTGGEIIGPPRACKACGKIGRERHPGKPEGLAVTNWACSPTCAEIIMSEPGWGVLGWLKI